MLTVHHPWHGTHYGEKAPAIVNALIEIPQARVQNMKWDKETGLLRLDRVIYSSFQISYQLWFYSPDPRTG
jgi:inorganic pyrophosphatase